METLVAHKVKIHLNNKQSSWMKDNCIACRLAYNFAIDRLRKPMMAYDACIDAATENQPSKFSSRIDGAIQPASLDFKKVKFPSAFDISKEWTIQRDFLHPWMKERNLHLDTISGVFNNNYGAALNQWKVAKWHKDKMPNFHGRGGKLSSIWRGRSIKQISRKTFELPKGNGTFRLGCELRFDGEVRSVTFSQSAGDWYASFLVKTDLPKPDPAPAGTVVGIDMGVAQFASLSTGEQFPPSMDYAKELEKLAKLQRQLSRMDGPIRGQRKASKNWLKQQKRIQKQHQHIANKRRNYTEIVSKSVATRFETVAIEDLKIRNMSASAKGDDVTPGKNVAQKAGLNRSILNGGFYQFRTRLEAKVNARGGQVIAVNPAYTSQTCAACGHTAKENRPNQATFKCVSCGHEDNADVNAAMNIMIRALNNVTVRDEKNADHQGTSTPASLPTESVGILAQEVVKQGALSDIPLQAVQFISRSRKKVCTDEQFALSL